MSSLIKKLESIMYCIRVKCLNSILPVYRLSMMITKQRKKKLVIELAELGKKLG